MQRSKKFDLSIRLQGVSRKSVAASASYSLPTLNNALRGRGISEEVTQSFEGVLGVPIWSESPVDRLLNEGAAR